MKICPNCQMSNDDSAVACAVCGSVLPVNQEKKSGSGKKILVIAAIAVLAATLVIGAATGVKALVDGGVGGAYKTAVKDLTRQFTQKTNARSNLDRLDTMTGKGNFSLQLTHSGDVQDLALHVDYSRSANAITGRMEYSRVDGLNLDVAYFANKRMVQLIPSGDSLNVYGFSVKDFEKKFEDSAIFKALPVSLPKTDLLDLLEADDLEDFLNKASNGAYKDLKKTLDVEKMGKRTLTISGSPAEYEVYQVTWDSEGLTEFLQKMDSARIFSDTSEFLENFLTKIEPDCYLYLDSRGKLRVADFVAVGTQYKLSLKGTQNPWEDVVLTTKTLDGTSHSYTGGFVSDGDRVTLVLDTEGDEFLSMVYDDSTGYFSLNTKKRGATLDGYFRESGSGISLELNLLPNSKEAQQFTLEIVPLQSKPKKFADKYTDLFSLGLNDIQRLLMDLGML